MTRALLERVTGPPHVGFGRPPPSGWGRRLLIGLAVAFWLVVISVGLAGLVGGHQGRPTQVAASPAPAAAPASGSTAVRSTPGPGLVWHTPVIALPNGSPAQQQYDQAFNDNLGSLPGMAAAQALQVAEPAVAGGWPPLAVQVTPERWAEAFVAGLLNVDYAHQSRAALAGWLQAQEAPELLPGVPASVADKVLSISVLDPALFGGQPTPLPIGAGWAAAARTGVRQRVSGILVQLDPGWAQMTAAGWQPTDVRMTEEDVSGSLTVYEARGARTHRFSVQIIVGSARWHDGYGTVAVSGWQEQ